MGIASTCESAGRLWAKTRRDDPEAWHPLILHMLDVAACAEAIMLREPQGTREQLAGAFGQSWTDARGWLLLLIAAHDLGKACPGFQCKWRNLSGMDAGRGPDTFVHHAFAGLPDLTAWLKDRGWKLELAESAADAVCSHHGVRCAPLKLRLIEGNRRALGSAAWHQARIGLLDCLMGILSPRERPAVDALSGAGYMLLAGLTSFADWIASSEDYFPFGDTDDCRDLIAWFEGRRVVADAALDAIGWSARAPLCSRAMTFQQLFDFSPRPLQLAVGEAISELDEPAIILVEAPMGEGKTEAALFAFQDLQRRLGHRGLYIAMPTQATGNAMFTRTCEFLARHNEGRVLDIHLLHGASSLNTDYHALRLNGIHDEDHHEDTREGALRAAEWFTRKKRGLLTEYGVGTVDQALLPIMPVRHQFVRLWGLANRVVVFDEIHAYDMYTGTLLQSLLRWLHALDSTVILLSATLPASVRRSLAEAFSAQMPETEKEYPRITVFRPHTVTQHSFIADPSRRQSIHVEGIGADPSLVRDAITEKLADGGLGLALVNTVQRAQELYRTFPRGELLRRSGHCIGKRLPDGTDVFLFHARYPAFLRKIREDNALAVFGRHGDRSGRKILIATQVAEQSLDLDFDVIATDLAPVDLVLQRAGRLWRHERGHRSLADPLLLVAGLTGDEPPDFGSPLWWSAVYREDHLLLTWLLLRGRMRITVPDEIDALVQSVDDNAIDIPPALNGRWERAMQLEGKACAQRQHAYGAIIGFPEDESWNNPAQFALQDEYSPGLHRTLLASTRLGDESATAIPLWAVDAYQPERIPDEHIALEWYSRAVRLSRRSVMKALTGLGTPAGWSRSPLLRNCQPLILDEHGQWVEDAALRLDEECGIVYTNQEV